MSLDSNNNESIQTVSHPVASDVDEVLWWRPDFLNDSSEEDSDMYDDDTDSMDSTDTDFISEVYDPGNNYIQDDMQFTLCSKFKKIYDNTDDLLAYYIKNFNENCSHLRKHVCPSLKKLVCKEKLVDSFYPMIFKSNLKSCSINLEKNNTCPICLVDKTTSDWVQIIQCGHRICAECAASISNIPSYRYPMSKCCMCRHQFEIYSSMRIETMCNVKNIKWTIVTNMLISFRNDFKIKINEADYKRAVLYKIPSASIRLNEYCVIYCSQSLNDAIETCYQKYLKCKKSYIYTIYMLMSGGFYHEVFINFFSKELSTGYYTLGTISRTLSSATDACSGYGGYFFANLKP